MHMEEVSFEDDVYLEAVEDAAPMQNRRSATGPASFSCDGSRSFECSICLDSADDPVVTLCGHLYCWPCVYKWINAKGSSANGQQQAPSCPVCKANISINSLIPLYARSSSPSESETKKAVPDVAIPRRPAPSSLDSVIGTASLQSQQIHPSIFQSQLQPFHQQRYFQNPHGGYTTIASSNLGVSAMASFFNPMIVMFGELMPVRIFGISDMSLFTFPSPNPRPLSGSINPRMRRHEMKLEKSLNRVTIFLLCCIILCLLLF